MALPLEGIVVADLTQNVAGPFCTQILGDMGAEIVKIERPRRGDDARAWAPPYWGDESAAFMAMNRNKKSLALDVKRDGGGEVLRRLLARADVFIQSLRAGAIEELGLDFAGARAQPQARVLLGHRVRRARTASRPPRLRPAHAGVRRSHVDQRTSRR